jgi:hypothetical protein
MMSSSLVRVLRAFRVRALGGLLLLCLGAFNPAGLVAQPSGAPDELRVYAYTLQYQSINEALAVVRPLLSARGTVEIQPGGNTIVLRDVAAALDVIVPQLRAFDHEPRTVRLQVQVVQAFQGQTAGNPAAVVATQGRLSPALLKRLRELLRYEAYVLQADVRLDVREGEEALYELGSLYTVGFRVGGVVADRRVKLNNFRITRRPITGAFEKPEQQLLATTVNLWLDQTLILGLARDESAADALMLVVSASRPK